MENLNPVLTLLIGAISGILLLILFPELRVARFRKEIADSEKVNAETDSIQLGAIADYLIAATKSSIEFSQAMQANFSSFAETLKSATDSNIELLTWVKEKEKEIAEERHLLLSRIDELGLKIKQLQHEKDTLEETLEAANIRIGKLESDNASQKKELKQLKELERKYNELKEERDNLLAQMAGAKMPESPALLVEDSAKTKILEEIKP